MPWYSFTPIPPSCDPNNPNNWTLVGPIPPPCPPPNNFLCAIQASDNMGKPIITVALSAEIAFALQNHVDTTNVLLFNVNRC
jgi:hypothetical protein